MKSNYSFVNVFQGSGKIDLPKPEGLASKWLFIKAQCGNTTPAASYPFGKTSLCAYTGGYPTGYGNHTPNSCGEPPTFDASVHGFSHMHQSGTGGIKVYYNFALTTPIASDSLGWVNDSILREEGSPGYYFAELASGIIFEGTVSQKIAYHRYTMPQEGILQIDFSNLGLDRQFKGYFDIPEKAEISVVSDTRINAHIKAHGIDLYFATECPSSKSAFLWQNYIKTDNRNLIPGNLEERFGAAFKVSAVSELKTAISFISCAAAEAMLDSEKSGFDFAKGKTKEVWEEYLGRIDIETDSESLREIFYSNLCHSLIKPCNGCGESFLYDVKETDGKFYFDFATLWDQYKTALPLIFTLYPNESRDIAETLLHLTEKNGMSPVNVTVALNNDFPDQARMLVEHILADFYFRGGESFAERILEVAQLDLKAQKDFLKSGFCPRYTQILDICEAIGAIAEIAHNHGKNDIAQMFDFLSQNWINAFDKESGMMSKKSPYYEGTNKNYSFRLLRNMDDRIALMGKERFLSELDELFGYTRDAVERPINPYKDPLYLGIESFEGFNNESDIEAPYAYLFAGRHDKTCEILRAGMKYMFTTGRGGLPGNNDSGGLSSFYVWNALGLFPVSGQNLILIGSPIVDGARLILANGNELLIKVHGQGDEHIYVKSVLFNGNPIENFNLPASTFMQGGKLDIFMQ